jgi:hypothetical protein
VENGGQVVVSFGDQVDLAAFSVALESMGAGRAGPTVVPNVSQGAEAIIGQVDLRHPIFAPFEGAGRGAILRPTFRRYVRLVPDSTSTVIGTFDTGDPFLVERRLGRGRLLVYASTLGTDWTNFPINELYVPFVHQLVKYAVDSGTARRAYTVGETVVLEGRVGETWDVRSPEGRLFKVDIDETGSGFFRETSAPGNYVAARGAVRFPFSVNVDTEESDLESRDEEEVYASVVPPSVDQTEAGGNVRLIAQVDERSQKLWRIVLLAAIALLALETLLANRPTRKVASLRKR